MKHLRITARYFKHRAQARNEHGIHPPFLFDLYCETVKDPKHYYAFDLIEHIREQLLNSEQEVKIVPFGEDSIALKGTSRKVKDIARTSLKPEKQAQFLFRLVEYLKPKSIIDLGTSLGITTAYLASANSRCPVYSLEGNGQLLQHAKRVFEKTHVDNVKVIEGNIDSTLAQLLKETDAVDFCFVDANHKKEPTLSYFELLKQKSHENTCLVFDDIHWSEGMSEAWNSIRADSSVTLSVDLFHVGLIFFNKNFSKQHFTLKM